MWVWTVEEQLLNLDQVEAIELIEILADGADPEDESAEPELFEVVATLPSGREMLLYASEDGLGARYALEVLASFLGTHGVDETFGADEALSLADLVRRVGEKTKN